MTDQYRSASHTNNSATPKVANDLTPRKTMFVLVIVVGCFAVLWPKVFYPMLAGSANQYIKPSPIDKTTGCCDVISEIDVNTIKIMSELCSNIVQNQDVPLSGKEIVMKCRSAVLETCGIDISAVLQEQVRLGQTVKQILDEIRSLNGSLCLKYNFGVAPWRLGVPHRVNIKVQSESVRQERPPHLRSEMVHPAFRERGRAIPQTQTTPSPSRPPPRIVEGRPGPIPGMRPTMGGPGHVVPPPKQGTGSMGLIMPIYTIGIVIFFTYTVMKVVFKKQPPHGALYPPVEPDRNFRKEVFESERVNLRQPRDGVASKIGDAELDQLRRRLRETELAMERIVEQMAKVPLKMQQEDNLANGNAVKPQEEQASVKIVGMEMTASCEGGKKWSRPSSPVLPNNTPVVPKEPSPPPQEIYLEGALPPQSQLLVTDSATEEQKNSVEDETPIVLAGKMTLSVISLDSSENGNDDSNLEKKVQFDTGARSSSSNASEEFEKIDIEQSVEAQIAEIIEEARNITAEVELVKNNMNDSEEMNEEENHIVDEYELNENENIDDNNELKENERQIEEEDQINEEANEVEEEYDSKEDAEQKLEDKNEKTDVNEKHRDTETVSKSIEQDAEDDEEDEEEEIEEDEDDEEEIEVDEDEEVEYEDSDEGESVNEEQQQRVQVVATNGNNVNDEFKNHLENNGDSASQSEDEDVDVEEVIEYVDDDEEEEEEDETDDNNIEIRNANNTNGA